MDKRAATALGLIAVLCSCKGEPPPEPTDETLRASVTGERIDFLEKMTIGDPPPETPPWIANVAVVDLDQDGLVDVVLCDVTKSQIGWIRQTPAGTFTETPVSSVVLAPAHVTPSDVDLDGDMDLLVAEMGQIRPSNEKIGTVTLLENRGDETFEHRALLDGVARVTDIQPGDFDDDGDILYTNGDAFDYIPSLPRPWHGAQWLENRGGLDFVCHRLADFPGAYSAKAADADNDGDLDVFVVSMFADWSDPEAASIAWLENNGNQEFTLRTIDSTPTHLLVLDAGDLDGDGWMDVVTGGMYSHEPFDDLSRVTWWRNRCSER